MYRRRRGYWESYYEENGEAIRARNREAYHGNRAERRAGQKQWYERNKLAISERRNARYREDPDFAEDMRRRARERYHAKKASRKGV